VIAIIGLSVFALVIGLVAWAGSSRWLAGHDWVFNKHNPRKFKAGSLGLLETIYQPSIQYVIDEQTSQRARGSQDESGDKPEAGRTEQADPD